MSFWFVVRIGMVVLPLFNGRKNTDWSKYDGKKHCVFEPARMSPETLEAGTEWVARRFYSLRSITRRLSHSRAGIWWNLPRNLGYMLANLSSAGPK